MGDIYENNWNQIWYISLLKSLFRIQNFNFFYRDVKVASEDITGYMPLLRLSTPSLTFMSRCLKTTFLNVIRTINAVTHIGYWRFPVNNYYVFFFFLKSQQPWSILILFCFLQPAYIMKKLFYVVFYWEKEMFWVNYFFNSGKHWGTVSFQHPVWHFVPQTIAWSIINQFLTPWRTTTVSQ